MPSRHYRYHPAVERQLVTHGIRPRATTEPERAREQVNDLYLHEIRRQRRAVRAGEFPLSEYSDRIIELRKRYWLLSLTVDRWAESVEIVE